MSRLLPVLALLLACADEPLPISDRDTDGDCLMDNVEIGLGTNPFDPDSDGDGYWDGDEAHEGSDPADPEDWIYEGGWPYWAGKEFLGWPEADGPLVVGEPMFRFLAPDQFGDRVDLYDFAGAHQEHRWIVVNVVAEWCSVDYYAAEWLSGGPDYGLEAKYGPIRQAIREGGVLWITVVARDSDGDTTDREDVARWAESYPNRHIPVFADRHGEIEAATVGATGGYYPSQVLVRAADMEVVALEAGVDGVLPELMERMR